MSIVSLHDKTEIEAFLRRNTFLHLYEIGDLDEFFWNYTVWYALKVAGQIEQLALVYTGIAQPVLLAFDNGAPDSLRELLRSMAPVLPARLYAHLHAETVTALDSNYAAQSHGVHYKMALQDTTKLQAVDTSRVVQLGTANFAALTELFEASYPGNWFDRRMLETGCFYGILDGSQVVSVAGIHVYSPRYRVATLGNVTTHPDFRGRGLGTAVCAKLCESLLVTVDHVGLNVQADNAAAIACYRRLGFARVADYEEFSLELK